MNRFDLMTTLAHMDDLTSPLALRFGSPYLPFWSFSILSHVHESGGFRKTALKLWKVLLEGRYKSLG